MNILRILTPVILGLGGAFFCFETEAAERIEVSHVDCHGLDVETFGDLLLTELELSAAFAATTQMKVELVCTEAEVKITINDNLTEKSLERSVPNSGSEQPGWEREIALAASQLCIASWLELLVAEPESTGKEEESRGTKPGESGGMDESAAEEAAEQKQKAVEEARALASNAIDEELVIEPKPGRLSLAGGIRYRPIQPAIASFYVAARGGGWLSDRIGLFAHLAFESGHFDREIGQVRAIAGLAGVGIAWRHFFSELFLLELAPTASIGYVNLGGDLAEAGVQMDSIGGVTGEFALNISPVFDLGRVMLSPNLIAGYMIENPVGRILTQQVERVSMGGLILGVTLEIGFLF